MSGGAGAAFSVAAVECAKLRAQRHTTALLAACAAAPFVFVAAMSVQPAVPSDTLFGRMVHESGLATPLIVLGFAGLWALPVLAGLAGGDQFSSEDRYATWSVALARSRSRRDVFAGKVLASFAFATVAIAVLAASALAAGVIAIGTQPIVDLSGRLLAPREAIARTAVAWMSVLPAYFAFTAAAILCSVATRSSIAGVGLPALIGFAMQLFAAFDGPPLLRQVLLTTGFESWRGLFATPAFIRPLGASVLVSGVYMAVCIGVAYRIFRNRDVVG